MERSKALTADGHGELVVRIDANGEAEDFRELGNPGHLEAIAVGEGRIIPGAARAYVEDAARGDYRSVLVRSYSSRIGELNADTRRRTNTEVNGGEPSNSANLSALRLAVVRLRGCRDVVPRCSSKGSIDSLIEQVV